MKCSEKIDKYQIMQYEGLVSMKNGKQALLFILDEAGILAVKIIPHNQDVSLERTLNYVPEKDPGIQAAIEQWCADSKR